MNDARVTQFVELLLACHGVEARKIALQRIIYCLRRGEPEWAELYRKVAEEIVRHYP